MTARITLATALCITVGACASASRSVPESALALTAEAAWPEARVQARGWDADARLQYVQGAAVTADGTVLRDAGYWRFVYAAPGRDRQLAVTVTPLDVQSEERTPQSPPGFVTGDRTLDADWIDSSEALAAVPTFGSGTRVPMLLVPLSPERWIITIGEERYMVNAATGAVIQ